MSPIHSFNTDSQRYCVGIDLGTTNCAVAYFDREKSNQAVQLFRIPQLGKYGYEETLTLFPSCIYLDETEQLIAGTWAGIQGAKVPTRLVQSAKSWLSNPAANRREKILPFDEENAERRLSPVEASVFLLKHIREMWNRQMARSDPQLILEEQEIILTVPASFDEVARSLTVEAASKNGFKHLTLLEEPQAAFYNWLMEHASHTFTVGESILVCDVGGGTTDFSLIDILENEKGLEMRRMAVGKHLLLGGDNMDAALSHFIENKIGQELDRAQHLGLIHQARIAKEQFFKDNHAKEYSIFLSKGGSKVIEGSISLTITRQEVEKILLEGFFEIYPFEEAIRLKKGSGIRQMGLAYEAEPSITRHLAYFLYKNNRKTKPTYLLFNGGAMKPSAFQNRILQSLDVWYPGATQTHILASSSLDLAVAKGAAYFGKVRHTPGVFITGGIPRSYYLQIETSQGKKALTLLARGALEGEKFRSEHLFSLIPNQAAVFQLYHSHTRLNDKPGDLICIDEEELTALPPIQTICQFGKKGQTEPISVQLEIQLTAIGILEIWLIAQHTNHKWKLEFQVNADTQEKRLVDETFEVNDLEAAKKEVQEAFAIGSSSKLNSLMGNIEKILEKPKNAWPPSLLRGLWETLSEQADKRIISSQYESRFWNLVGFLLRPGIGYPLDDHRIKQMWKWVLADLKRQKSEEVQLQQWICYRRIAAGLSKGCQIQLFGELSLLKLKKKGYIYAEHLRALASFELVDTSAKIKLGNHLLNKILTGQGEPCDYWALARLGARQLFYGTAANVIPAKYCEEWIMKLIQTPAAQNEHLSFTLTLLARKTGYRQIDLAPSILEKVAPHIIDTQDLLFNERTFTLQEQERFFGDALPTGLTLHL